MAFNNRYIDAVNGSFYDAKDVEYVSSFNFEIDNKEFIDLYRDLVLISVPAENARVVLYKKFGIKMVAVLKVIDGKKLYQVESLGKKFTSDEVVDIAEFDVVLYANVKEYLQNKSNSENNSYLRHRDNQMLALQQISNKQNLSIQNASRESMLAEILMLSAISKWDWTSIAQNKESFEGFKKVILTMFPKLNE